MLILAVDTTSDLGGVGIFRDAECLASVLNEDPMNRYSITLFQMVERALTHAHLELREINLYAVANGPGSFTGIRIGLAAARAWGKAFQRPVRGVSVLEAMVNKQRFGVRDSGLGPDWFFPILDARRAEFYVGSFRRCPLEPPDSSTQDYESADEGWVLKPDMLRAYLDERAVSGASATCVVRAHELATADLRACLPASLNWQAIEGDLMDSLAGIARKEEQSGRPCSHAKLEAYYIRRPDAEVNWVAD